MKILLLSILLLVPIISAEEELYSIVAPRWLIAHEDYNVLVSIHKSDSPVNVEASITHKPRGADGQYKPNDNGTVILEDNAKVSQGESKLISLKIGELADGVYQLNLKGMGGINFERISGLDTSRKNVSLFIQTDKAIYQPSQTIKFRVVAVDKYLKPIVEEPLEIYIQDSYGNRIKQWKGVTTRNGIFEDGELLLSSQPLLGDWTIFAEVRGESSQASVTIQEYVLPTFEVSVNLPPYATYNDSDVIVDVKAKYTFGKPVKGNLVIQAREEWCSRPYASCANRGYVKTMDIDGKATITIPLNELNFGDGRHLYQNTYAFQASVTEQLTGKQENGSKSLTFYPNGEKIEFVTSSQSFKPGLPFEILVKLSYRDDRPVSDATEQLSCTTSFVEGTGLTFSVISNNYTVPADGVVKLSLDPRIDTESLRTSCKYKGQEASNYVGKADSLSTRFLNLDVPNKEFKIGEKVPVTLSSTTPIQELRYLVIAKGNIISTEVLPVKGSKEAKFEVTVTENMVPKGRIICYLLTGCGEVVADAVEFQTGDVFKTPVKVYADINETKPAGKVLVTVETKPNSIVGLKAIDQSVLLLKRGNELTQNDVLNELQNYELGRRVYYPIYGGYFPFRPISTDATGIFKDSGMLFFTSGLLSKPVGGYGGGYYPEFYGSYPNRARPQAASMPGMPGMPGVPGIANKEGSSSPSLRSHFPETWIWKNIQSGADGKAEFPAVAPDTITSWVISAIALNPETGLGVAPTPYNVTVFRPFFVNLNLPYSIIRGEIVTIQALVFNYFNKDVEAEVVLSNDDNATDFEVVDQDNAVTATPNTATEKVTVPTGNGKSVTFRIKPTKVGPIGIKVKATTSLGGDAILKKLIVKPEGSPKYFNEPVLLDLREKREVKENVDIEVPADAVPGSEFIEVSAIGDVMAPIMKNLENLVRMPYGCGEQNLVSFVPDIAVLDYLTKSGKLEDDMKKKLITFLETGYQKQLTYKHGDGSYSAFGGRGNGSTWLTAFVMKSFGQAKPYIAIDENVLRKGLSYLASTQQPNGSFAEWGNVFSKSLMGGSGDKVGFTAYVLVAFLENKDLKPADNEKSYEEVVKKSVKYLEDQLPNLKSKYEQAVVAYALQKADSPKKDEAYKTILDRAEKKGALTSLGEIQPPVNKSDPFYCYNVRRPVDIEMSSYLLLTAALRKDLPTAISVAQYLLAKRNSFGGYGSTQDTVIGVEALASIATELAPADTDIAVNVKYGDKSKDLTLNKEKSLLLQKVELPKESRKVEVTGKGKGFGLAQVSYSYYENKLGQPSFDLKYKVVNKTDNSYGLEICADYTEDGNSNMAIIDVNLPSGYTYDKRWQSNTRINREESKDGSTGVIFYFNEMGNGTECVNVGAQKAFTVDFLKPALIAVYDYYAPEKRAEKFYDLSS